MKKVLVLIDWYLPGYKAGGPIRSMANMIAALKQDYCFYVVCRNTDYLEKIPYENIKSDEWNQLSENENVYYISHQNLSLFKLKKLITSIKFDVIYINGIYSFYFSISPLLLCKIINISKLIVAPRGMLSEQAFSAKKVKKKIYIFFVRFLGLYKNSIMHATSDVEKNDISNLKLKLKEIALLPNLPPLLPVFRQERIKNEGELKLISVARISREKNTLFALECLNNLSFKGKIIYDIYGSVYDKSYWEQCLEAISQMPLNVEVRYCGDLNNNKVFETLNQYHFLYLPSKGENFGHSILESFIAGCPVIISNTTPWQNLEEKQLGWDIELKKELFIKTLQIAVDINNVEYQVLSEACRKFAIQVTENKMLIEDYKELFR